MTTYNLAANSDDGWRRAAGINNADVRVILGFLTGDNFSSWYRYQISNINQGDTILSAKLTFTAKETDGQSNDMDVLISCEDVDTAAIPVSVVDFDGKDRTTANTAWQNPEAWVAESPYDSPDFTSAVQEVIDRGGWAANNFLQVLIDDNGSTSEHREAYSRDGDAAKDAVLIITFVAGFTPSMVIT